MGDRDSELGLFISDAEHIDSFFNGRPFKVSRFAHSLRCQLFLEHLGLTQASGVAEDPVCDDTWTMWQQRSRTNTDVLRAIFPAMPDSRLRTIKEYRAAQAEPWRAGRLDLVVGHLVDYPAEFLGDESDGAMSSSALVGVEVFV